MKKLLSSAAIAIGAALMVTPAVADDNIHNTPYKDWVKTCADLEGVERCQLQQTIMIKPKDATSNKENKGAIVQLTALKNNDLDILNVLVPKGIDLRAGLLLQVDEGKKIRLPYSTCTDRGCLSVIKIDDAYKETLKKGKELIVAFVPFGSKEVVGIKASLMGFTEGYKSLN